MKKMATLTALLLLVFLFVGCNTGEKDSSDSKKNEMVNPLQKVTDEEEIKELV